MGTPLRYAVVISPMHLAPVLGQSYISNASKHGSERSKPEQKKVPKGSPKFSSSPLQLSWNAPNRTKKRPKCSPSPIAKTALITPIAAPLRLTPLSGGARPVPGGAV